MNRNLLISASAFALFATFLIPWTAQAQEEDDATTEDAAEALGELAPVIVEGSDPVVVDDRAPTPRLTETSSATFDTIEEPGKDQDLLDIAATASMGQASGEELMARPFLRRGELLEVVPGMIVTQHSGTGKANQYFVRGFNLDHGTDFGVFVDGMPVNKRTHAHGQGYADLNFIIPELVEKIDYTKGPYFSDLGDFTTAGSARFGLYDVLPHGMASVTGGEDDYFRFLAMDSAAAGSGMLSTAVEYVYYDGPWVLEEDSERINVFSKYYWESGMNRYSLTGMAYRGEWTSTDQIPKRLVDRGTIDRLGFVDPTVGGDSQRYSLSFDWVHEGDASTTELDAYLGYYDLDLFSNFTYFLDDPVNGDQFNQVDRRTFAGFALTNTRPTRFLDRDGSFTAGFQTHHDWIDETALYNTVARRRIGTVRSDGAYETNLSGFANQELIVNDWLKLNGGIRGDLFYFDVDSNDPLNSGNEWAGMASPKLGAVFGPWHDTEFYTNWGGGFHSNDARGVTIARDPATGLPADPVDPLVRQWGTEVGLRTRAIPNVVSTIALWYLESDSELLFVGDAGNTEPGPGTQRHGIEWATYWNPTEWLRIDGELSVAEAEFRDKSEGRYVENAVPVAFSAGITAGRETGPYASFRSRYFSERPLTADKSVESRDSLVFNLRTGYRQETWDVYLELLNLFDTDANDIEYFYESRLPGEPLAGVSDIHFHPLEPRTVRAGVAIHW
ncbi:MAG: TonB-dependent receptor plug domain-containing protein [Verrucomicrobiales bacterium]